MSLHIRRVPMRGDSGSGDGQHVEGVEGLNLGDGAEVGVVEGQEFGHAVLDHQHDEFVTTRLRWTLLQLFTNLSRGWRRNRLRGRQGLFHRLDKSQPVLWRTSPASSLAYRTTHPAEVARAADFPHRHMEASR